MKKLFAYAAPAIAAAAIMALSTAGANAVTLINAGFEDAPHPGVSDQFYFDYNSTNNPPLSGWTVTVNSVDVVSSGPNPYAMNPHGGTQSLDLVGVGNIGGISQSFATVSGESYVLSFWYANNFYSTSNASASVSVNGALSLLSASVSHSTSSLSNMDWQQYSGIFIADSTTTTLSFLNTFGSNSGGVMLDDVSVALAHDNQVGLTPLPASWSMMLIGFATLGGLGAYRRRRLAAVKA